MNTDIRWRQRFDNFQRALRQDSEVWLGVERAILFDHPALREHIERVGQVLYERPLSDR